MTTDTLAKLAAELAQLASEGPALIHLQSGAYICRKLGESAKALAAQALPAAGRCDECGKDQADGWALYCVGCLEKTGLLAKEALPSAQHVSSTAADLTGPNDTAAQATTGAPSEPFGYFKAQPFGWTDCAEDDDGAVALYERPQQAALATAAPKVDTDTLRPLVARLALEIDPEADLEKFPEALAFQIDMARAVIRAALPQPPQPQSAQPEVTK